MSNFKMLLCAMIMFLPLMICAQTISSAENDKGIKWTTGLSWQQIKQKAKAENKYIFLDCYTTWCGPCKIMDIQVYGNDSVGDYFNNRFIAVKAQMDKTKKDNEEVQRWYGDVAAINDEYHVNAYPTFIFLSPQGIIIEKQMGFKGVQDFIALAQNAIVPGKIYNDPYADYYRFVSAYKSGKRDYNHYPTMINISNKLNENDFFNQLLKEFSSYISTLSRREKYTKERIEMWNQFTFPSNHSVFRFFYRDEKLIDKVMKQKGFANRFVDKTIQHEMVLPFFNDQNKNTSIVMSGMYLTGKGLSSDTSEADWDKLEQLIQKKYNQTYAERNVVKARVEWYNRHRNWPSYAEYALVLLNKYWSLDLDGPYQVNSFAWKAFMYSSDREIINGYIQWMDKVVKRIPDFAAALDTYANLLHKAGRTREGIQWETKAMNLVEERYKKQYQEIIKKMQRGEPTYNAAWLIDK